MSISRHTELVSFGERQLVTTETSDVPLLELREKAVAIKTCMSLTMEEVEKLILGDMVVKGSCLNKLE